MRLLLSLLFALSLSAQPQFTRFVGFGQSLEKGACVGSAPTCQNISTTNPNSFGSQEIISVSPNTYLTLYEHSSGGDGTWERSRSGRANQFASMSSRKVLADEFDVEGGYSAAQLAKGGTSPYYSNFFASIAGMSNFGSTYGWGAIFMHHGQQDFNICSPAYETALINQRNNMNTDSGATMPMIVAQWNAWYHYHSRTSPTCNGAASTPLNILQTTRDHFGSFVPAGPQYQYSYSDGLVHMTSESYLEAGELEGKVAYHVLVGGHKWTGTQPREMSRSGNTVTARMWICAADADLGCGSLALDTSIVSNVGTGKGFEYWAGWQGVVSCSGTACTRQSGDSFVADGSWNGLSILVMGAAYTISSVADASHLTLTSAVGWTGTVNTSGTQVLLQTCPQGIPTDGSWNGATITIAGTGYTISSAGLNTSIADGAQITLGSSAGTQTGASFTISGLAQNSVAYQVTLPSLPTITNVAVAGDTATITLSGTPTGFATERLRYAYTASGQVGTSGAPRGNIRDSDPTTGQRSGAHLYNWLWVFDDPLPFVWGPPAQGVFPQPSGFKRVAQ